VETVAFPALRECGSLDFGPIRVSVSIAQKKGIGLKFVFSIELAFERFTTPSKVTRLTANADIH